MVILAMRNLVFGSLMMVGLVNGVPTNASQANAPSGQAQVATTSNSAGQTPEDPVQGLDNAMAQSIKNRTVGHAEEVAAIRAKFGEVGPIFEEYYRVATGDLPDPGMEMTPFFIESNPKTMKFIHQLSNFTDKLWDECKNDWSREQELAAVTLLTRHESKQWESQFAKPQEGPELEKLKRLALPILAGVEKPLYNYTFGVLELGNMFHVGHQIMLGKHFIDKASDAKMQTNLVEMIAEGQLRKNVQHWFRHATLAELWTYPENPLIEQDSAPQGMPSWTNDLLLFLYEGYGKRVIEESTKILCNAFGTVETALGYYKTRIAQDRTFGATEYLATSVDPLETIELYKQYAKRIDGCAFDN
eukprot:TRINITY_DN4777_c0_g1_i1.p1 TRINITY_DN4777_c0_g1~~TRINITY_DN4777_c0_g1_i1.p1  ORF type:complete len:359 (+),score=29.56 TRINITY_DN4777_c0_g1_i1:63-1139(+)